MHKQDSSCTGPTRPTALHFCCCLCAGSAWSISPSRLVRLKDSWCAASGTAAAAGVAATTPSIGAVLVLAGGGAGIILMLSVHRRSEDNRGVLAALVLLHDEEEQRVPGRGARAQQRQRQSCCPRPFVVAVACCCCHHATSVPSYLSSSLTLFEAVAGGGSHTQLLVGAQDSRWVGAACLPAGVRDLKVMGLRNLGLGTPTRLLAVGLRVKGAVSACCVDDAFFQPRVLFCVSPLNETPSSCLLWPP